MKKTQLTLRGGSAVTAVLLAGTLFAAPAFAQSSDASTEAKPQTAPTAQEQSASAPAPEIVVTGSLIRNPAAATASPVVSLSSEDLSNRGITTVADALQLLTANNAGTNPPSWSAFGFATGASSPSLRGLNDAYTLTLFNGMRTAPYPLADDGYRNFVDINTIPASIVDKVDVLQDGASATYGSDAIAGVVNVIVKREITGVHLNGSAGISQRGDAGERRISGTLGYGKLEEQGFNVYVNGEYQKTDPLYINQRGAPFNTANQSSICNAAGICLSNGIRNGIQYDGSYGGFQSTTVPFVRPYNSSFTSQGGYQLLNPSKGCDNLTAVTLTAAQRAGTVTPATVCQQDLVNQYRMYNAGIERKGANARATVKVGPDAEAYAMFNFYNTTTYNSTTPSGYTGQTAAGGTQATVSSIFLPAYVCSAGKSTIGTFGAFTNALTASGCNASNGTLNPNNPFAASGNLARLVALPQVPRETLTDNKVYRFSAGISGTFGGTWNYNLAGTTSTSTLDIENRGYIYLQGMMDAIAQGTYNFVNPSANSVAATQQVFPTARNHSSSKLTQIQASLNRDFFKLPGGAISVAVTGAYRYEAIHNPSANAPNETNPNARYYGINAVGVDGSRNVWSAGYEVSVPVLTSLSLKALGSYDSYSTGQSRFSPKFEAQFKPIKEVKLRGTYSRGFRIPSFSEAFSLPTTGYVNGSINCSSATYQAFCAAHANNPSYYTGGYSYGLTSAGNSALQPEKSESFTAGIVLTPTRSVTLTADFWSTKITNVIVPVSATADIISQYYLNNGVVTAPGITVTKGVADQQNPGALPLLGTVVGSYKNADKFTARGIDLSGSLRLPLNSKGIDWISTANGSYLLRLEQTNADGSVSRYDGTLGPCNITSCSGAPKWRVTWQNTIDFNGHGNVSLTGYYTSGYSSVATDSGGTYGDCQASADAGQVLAFDDGTPVQCRAKAVFNLDGHAEIKVGTKFTLYGDMLNILNVRPPYEPNAAYGIYQFNPAWADRLFIGRYFRIGAKVDF